MGVRNGLYFGSMYTDGLNLLFFFFELDGGRERERERERDYLASVMSQKLMEK
jgi:hypothetical protein